MNSGGNSSCPEVDLWKKTLIQCANREQCWFGNSPTLKELNGQADNIDAETLVSSYLNVFNLLCSQSKLSSEQISILSIQIVMKYAYLKYTEIMLFFHDFIFYHKKENTFFGAIDPNIIMDALHTFVRNDRGNAIHEHYKRLDAERLAKEKSESIDWQQYCDQEGIDSSENPIERIISRFGRKNPKDTPESIKNSADELVNNRWGLDETSMKNARKSFIARYKSTPEYILGKE